MSATLNVRELLSNRRLFPEEVNVINIRTKTFPVNVYYNKESPDDIYEDISNKVCKIHQFLPKGGVLVFLPGKKEILQLVALLEEKLGDISSREYLKKPVADQKEEKEEDKESTEEFDIDNAEQFNPEDPELGEEVLPPLFEIQSKNRETFRVLPLYSKLDSEQQVKVFETSECFRTIVVATNVAETSLTIPGLKYLVDSGLEKVRVMDPATRATLYKVQFISQASALQRQGRVGRTNMGHCYRVYTPGVFDKMRKFREPEIRRVSLNHLILQLLMVRVKDVFSFPYITKPRGRDLLDSVKGLIELGAIRLKQGKGTGDFLELTQLGETLSHVPLEPLHAKMILLFRQRGLLVKGTFVVCSLVFENPLDLEKLNSEMDDSEQNSKNSKKQSRQVRMKLRLLSKFDRFLSPVSDITTYSNLAHFLFSRILKRYVQSARKLDSILSQEAIPPITEDELKTLANNFSLILCRPSSFLNTLISEFCEEFWLTQKVMVESCKFTLQIAKLFLSLETDEDKKAEILRNLFEYSKARREDQKSVTEILVQSLPHKVAFKKNMIIEEKKVTKVFDEDNNEVRVQHSSLIRRNSSFYLYSLKHRVGGRLVISGLTRVQNPTLLLKHSPEFTEMKVNLGDFARLAAKDAVSKPRIRVDATFGKGRWESTGVILQVSEFRAVHLKNQQRIEMVEKLKKVEDSFKAHAEESDEEVLDPQGLVASKEETEVSPPAQ